MGKGLGYYGADYEVPLIRDIAETWGDDCSGASEHDTAYCLYNLAWQYYMSLGVAGINFPPSGDAMEVKSRIDELSKSEIACLIQALAHKDKCKPLGFGGLEYSNKLILDISESWNELQDISEIDQYWLISELAEIYFKLYCDRPSEEAVDIIDRIEELDGKQIDVLIRTLAN